MKAIFTTYISAAGSRGARIKATAEGVRSLSIPYPHELNSSNAHAKAAVALCIRQGWTGELISGGRPDGRGDVFTFADSDRYPITKEAGQ